MLESIEAIKIKFRLVRGAEFSPLILWLRKSCKIQSALLMDEIFNDEHCNPILYLNPCNYSSDNSIVDLNLYLYTVMVYELVMVLPLCALITIGHSGIQSVFNFQTFKIWDWSCIDQGRSEQWRKNISLSSKVRKWWANMNSLLESFRSSVRNR